MNYDLQSSYTRPFVNEIITGQSGPPKPKQDFVWTDEHDDQPVELTQLLRSMMNANDREMAKQFVSSWFRQACSGNRTAFREIINRIEGPAGTDEEAEE